MKNEYMSMYKNLLMGCFILLLASCGQPHRKLRFVFLFDKITDTTYDAFYKIMSNLQGNPSDNYLKATFSIYCTSMPKGSAVVTTSFSYEDLDTDDRGRQAKNLLQELKAMSAGNFSSRYILFNLGHILNEIKDTMEETHIVIESEMIENSGGPISGDSSEKRDWYTGDFCFANKNWEANCPALEAARAQLISKESAIYGGLLDPKEHPEFSKCRVDLQLHWLNEGVVKVAQLGEDHQLLKHFWVDLFNGLNIKPEITNGLDIYSYVNNILDQP